PALCPDTGMDTRTVFAPRKKGLRPFRSMRCAHHSAAAVSHQAYRTGTLLQSSGPRARGTTGPTSLPHTAGLQCAYVVKREGLTPAAGVQKMGNLRDRDFVDVVSELSYWHERFKHGSMMGGSFFDDCAPVIKVACDIFVRHPHGILKDWQSDLFMRLPALGAESNTGITAQIAG